MLGRKRAKLDFLCSGFGSLVIHGSECNNIFPSFPYFADLLNNSKICETRKILAVPYKLNVR